MHPGDTTLPHSDGVHIDTLFTSNITLVLFFLCPYSPPAYYMFSEIHNGIAYGRLLPMTCVAPIALIARPRVCWFALEALRGLGSDEKTAKNSLVVFRSSWRRCKGKIYPGAVLGPQVV